MFSFLGRMFGSARAGEAIIDGVKSGVDKLFYTSEEKADDAAAARREGMAVYMKWLETTSGSRIARRLIALMVTGIWALEHLGSVVLEIIGVWASDPIRFNLAADALAQHANDNNPLVGVVLLFYFGGPAAIDGVKGLVNKWSDGRPPRQPGQAPPEHPSR